LTTGTATVPSSPHLVNPHKHLLSPGSSTERDTKRSKHSEFGDQPVDIAAGTMSSDEEYDDFVYDDDDGFEQDVMDQGGFEALQMSSVASLS
jgi:hypothetical protein